MKSKGLKVVDDNYFLNSILKPITCHDGIIEGFFITSPSAFCFQLIFSLLPTIETEDTGLVIGFEVFARDLIIISSSGFPRQYA